MGKNRKRDVQPNAYFSLEACLIMPLVFYCIVFLIYTGFYQYDRCLLYQDTYRLLIRGSQVKFVGSVEVAQRIQEEDAGWYYEKYAICSFGKKTVEVEHGNIHLSQEAALAVPFPVLVPGTGKGFGSIRVDVTGGRIRPTDTIRNCRKIEKVLERRKKDG